MLLQKSGHRVLAGAAHARERVVGLEGAAFGLEAGSASGTVVGQLERLERLDGLHDGVSDLERLAAARRYHAGSGAIHGARQPRFELPCLRQEVHARRLRQNVHRVL